MIMRALHDRAAHWLLQTVYMCMNFRVGEERGAPGAVDQHGFRRCGVVRPAETPGAPDGAASSGASQGQGCPQIAAQESAIKKLATLCAPGLFLMVRAT